jgi:hypothetical protein
MPNLKCPISVRQGLNRTLGLEYLETDAASSVFTGGRWLPCDALT